MPSFILLLLLFLHFLKSTEWSYYYDAILDHTPTFSFIAIDTAGKFDQIMEMSRKRFPDLSMHHFGNWTDMANFILAQKSDKLSAQSSRLGEGQQMTPVISEWVCCFRNILRYGNFIQQVPVDFQSIFWDPFDPQDQIMKIDILWNLNNSANLQILSNYYPSFFGGPRHFLTAFDPIEGGAQRKCELTGLTEFLDLKKFALMFGDGFIDDEFDPSGAQLEGGDPSVCGCLVAKLLHVVDEMVSNTPGFSEFDIMELRRIKQDILDVVLMNEALKKCKDYPNSFELFEDLMISIIRNMPEGREYLFNSGFVKHAMLVTVSRNGTRYDISVYNSGSGIDYHSFKVKGKHEKYIPLIKFTYIPLYRLKNYGIFRKLAEIYAVSTYGFDSLDSGSMKAFDERVMYESVLSILHPYEVPAVELSQDIQNLVTSQRSGVCAFRCFMVYIATKIKSFRFLKLLMSHAALTRALGKPEFQPTTSPVARRLVKFALENYARSVEKYGKNENASGRWNLEIFGDDAFWAKHTQYAKVWPVAESKKFDANTGFYDFVVSSKQFPFVDPYSNLMVKAIEIHQGFEQIHMTRPSPPLNLPNDLNQILAYSMAKLDSSNFMTHLEALLKLVSTCWLGTPDSSKVAFFISIIIYRWPFPSFEHDLYNEVFHESSWHTLNQSRLFRLVTKIVHMIYSDMKWYPQIPFAFAKITAIYHKTMVLIHEPFKTCTPIEALRSRLGRFDSVMFDSSIRDQMEKLSEVLMPQDGKVCFDTASLKLLQEPGNIIIEYLKGILVEHKISYVGSLSIKITELFSKKTAPYLPSALYFWRDMCLLTAKFLGRIDGETLYYSIPFIDPAKIYDPMTCCDLTKLDKNDSDSGCLNRIYRKTAHIWKDECSEYVMAAPSNLYSDFNTANMTLRRYLMTSQGSTLKANVSDNFFFINRSGARRSDPFVSFLNMLDECKTHISFTAFLNLGYQAINLMKGDDESQQLLLDTLLRHLSYDLQSLLKMKDQLVDKTNIIPDVSNLAERTAALLLLAGYTSSLTISSTNILEKLKQLRKTYYDLCSLEGNSEYLAVMQLGFLASFRPSQDIIFDNDEAIMILVLNQTFSGITKALPEHLRIDGLKFSAMMNVSHAIYSFYHSIQSVEETKKLSSLPIDPNLFRPYFPWLAINETVLIDLVSGTVFKGASRVTNFIDDEVKTAFNLAQMDSAKYEISEISSSIRGRNTLTIYEFKLGTKFHIEESEKVTDVLFGRHHVTRLETIKSNTVHYRLRFNNGHFAYLIREQPRNLWSALPLPATSRQDIPYLIWVFPATNEIAFDSEAGCVWVKGGMTSLMKEKLTKLSYIPWGVRDAVPFIPEPKFPLALTQHISMFYRSEDSVSRLYILFRKLTDLEGNRLIFYHKLNDGAKWMYKNNENYFVSPEQEFTNSLFLKNSLVVQNASHKKVFIPIGHTLVTRENLAGMDEDPVQQLKCVLVPLNENNVLDPKSQLQFLTISYQYLIARNYSLSMEALIRIHHMEGFTDEELRVLGWIVHSGIDNHDGSPESTAIRSYAAYLIFANANLHAKGYIITPEMSAIETTLPAPYVAGLAWRAYWSRFVNRKIGDDVITKTVKRYYRVRSKVPVTLRYDPNSRRQLITRYEEKKWLEFVNVKLFDPQSSDPELYMNSNLTHFTSTGTLNGNIVQQYYISGNYRNESTLDLDKVSWVYPEVLITKFPLILVELLFKDFVTSEKQRYIEFFESLRDTAFSAYAKPFYDVLTDEALRLEWRDRVMNSNVTEINERVKNGIWRYKTTKRSKIPQNYLAYNEDDEVEENILMVDEIVTKNFPDYDGKQVIDITAIKSSGNLPLLHSTLKQLIEYRRDISGALSKSTVTQNTKKRRLVAKGFFAFVRTDFFRLYVQASLEFYKQLLPEIVAPENYQPLHDLITQYVLLTTNINDVKRMIAAYEKGDADEIEKELRRVRYTTSEDRIPLTYEFFINSRLDHQQLNDFKALMKIGKDKDNISPKLIQRIMSAGKTFVYGTCLAVGHADGEHLSILVVPKSLFTSEASSIINRTMGAFSFDGFSFHIARDSNITSSETLNWIYQSLLKAIKLRKYLIMPPETLLVLQNMFFENSIDGGDFPRFHTLKKICSLLKKKGVIVFDEVDTLFEPIHELNFSVSTSIQTDEKSDLLKLQGYLLGEMFYCLLHPEIMNIQDVRLNKLITEDDYLKIRPLLARMMARKLIKETFVLDVMSNPRIPRGLFGSWTEDQLTTFFELGPMKLGPFRHIFAQISGIQLNLLSLCRLAIQDWIYMAWSGNVNENYGVSPNPDILYAIPYLGAGNPKVDSEFSFRWYAYARSFRMYMVLGFGKPAFEKSLVWIKKKILAEEAESRSEELLRNLFGIGPYGLNLRSKEQIASFYEVVDSSHKNRSGGDDYYIFLFDWIASDLLPSINFFAQQISSNCQDIPMMVKSYCAYSGTVPSTKQMPPMMHKEKYVDLQDDITERIKDAVLRNSPSNFFVVPTGLTSKQFLEMIRPMIQASEKKGSPFSAVIDVGAYFKDESNESVADSLLDFKEAVIFYGTEGKGKNKPSVSTKTEKTRFIPDASRTGIQHLGFMDVNRVTYFDQQHVVGTDIHHNPKGFALVIVGVKTTSRDFYQAVMRMRSLLDDQQLLVVVPRDAYAAISKHFGKDRSDLIGCLEYMEHNLMVRRKKLNLMSLFKIIRAQFREAIYEKMLSDAGTKCSEVGLWIKETEAKIELLAMPQSERSTFELVEQFANHLGQISEPYIDRERFMKVREKVRRIVIRAKQSADDYEPNITVYSAEGEATKNEDIMGVGEQLMEHQIEAAKLVDLEVENTTTAGFSARSFSSPFVLDFTISYFPEVPDYSIQSDSLEPGLLSLNKFFKANPAFNLLSDIFDDRIYISKGFTDVFFGKLRNFIFDVLVLVKTPGVDSQGDVEMPAEGNMREMRLVILSSIEARAFMQLGTSAVFGSFLGQLLSPSEHADIDQRALGLDLETFKQLMTEVLIFGGYYNRLSEPEWLGRFEKWLGDDSERLLKSAIFREIILDELEWKDAIRSRLPITSVCLHQISPFDYLNLIERPEFIMLNFLCRKKYPIVEYYERNATKPKIHDIEVLLAEAEAVFKLDDDGLIISSVLPKLLHVYSQKKSTSSEESESYARFKRLALGLTRCPKKLIKILEGAVNTLDLGVDQNYLAVLALSESLGMIMVRNKAVTEDVSAMLRRFASNKVFNNNPSSIHCLEGLLLPDYDRLTTFRQIIQNLSIDDRKAVEHRMKTSSVVFSVRQAYLEFQFEKLLMQQGEANFPQYSLANAFKKVNKLTAAQALLKYCRTKASISRAVNVLFQDEDTKKAVLHVLQTEYENRTDEDARGFIISMLCPQPPQVTNMSVWPLEEPNKRFKTGK